MDDTIITALERCIQTLDRHEPQPHEMAVRTTLRDIREALLARRNVKASSDALAEREML
tara:strand:- start:464 stop:640 length:177 start_codon:yes stop_codon:yes gene_type:complete